MSLLELVDHPLARAATLVLLHFLWQGLLIAVALAALVELLRIRRASQRYACSLVALLIMAAMPVVTLLWLLRSPVSVANTEAASDLALARVSAVATAWRSDVLLELQPYILTLWGTGVAFFSCRLLLGVMGVRQLCRARMTLPRELANRVERFQSQMGMGVRAVVFLSQRVGDAMAVGLVRPIVLIPAAWVTEMPPTLLEAIIAHELAHLRRGDMWVNVLQRLIEALLFYHPAVWWLSRRMRIEREFCCDELAVGLTGRRLEYAQALEIVARREARVEPLLAASIRGEKRMQVLARVRNVLGMSSVSDRSRVWPAGLLVLLLPMAAWFGTAGLVSADHFVAVFDEDDDRDNDDDRPATRQRDRDDDEDDDDDKPKAKRERDDDDDDDDKPAAKGERDGDDDDDDKPQAKRERDDDDDDDDEKPAAKRERDGDDDDDDDKPKAKRERDDDDDKPAAKRERDDDDDDDKPVLKRVRKGDGDKDKPTAKRGGDDRDEFGIEAKLNKTKTRPGKKESESADAMKYGAIYSLKKEKTPPTKQDATETQSFKFKNEPMNTFVREKLQTKEQSEKQLAEMKSMIGKLMAENKSLRAELDKLRGESKNELDVVPKSSLNRKEYESLYRKALTNEDANALLREKAEQLFQNQLQKQFTENQAEAVRQRKLAEAAAKEAEARITKVKEAEVPEKNTAVLEQQLKELATQADKVARERKRIEEMEHRVKEELRRAAQEKRNRESSADEKERAK